MARCCNFTQQGDSKVLLRPIEMIRRTDLALAHRAQRLDRVGNYVHSVPEHSLSTNQFYPVCSQKHPSKAGKGTRDARNLAAWRGDSAVGWESLLQKQKAGAPTALLCLWLSGIASNLSTILSFSQRRRPFDSARGGSILKTRLN
eukprot:3044064-Rhodomonas_salina.7